METARWRGALIGCGFFAQNHIHAWRDLAEEGVDLVAVCDRDVDRARAAAARFGIARAYADAAEMLSAERLDFVDVATRADTHRALVGLALGRGVRTIVQKPLAPGWEDAIAMAALAARTGVPLAVHENFRYQAPMLRVAEVLASGRIGRPSWARIAFRTGFDVYRTQPYFREEARLAILDVGVHVLDLARVFLGEVERVACETQRRDARNRGEDTATMLLRHAGGAVGVVDCTYEARALPDPFPQTLVRIEGERGAVVLDAGFRMTVTSDGAVEESDVGAPPLPWTEAPWHVAQASVLATQRAILSAWREGREAPTSAADNLKTFALAEAAYQAAAEGRSIRPEVWRP